MRAIQLIINEKYNFNDLDYINEQIVIFIDVYMSTEIYKYLLTLSMSNDVTIYIKNIGKEVTTDIEVERQTIIENNDNIRLDNYRPYTLFTSGLNNYIDAKVGIISDSIQFTTFENTTNMFYMNDKTYTDILTEDLDLVVFITTWAGIYDEYIGPRYESTSKTLHRILTATQEANIPIVFYSKEDPPNFINFKQYVRYADMIFTSSMAKIPEYKELKRGVEVLNFTYGINPSHCSPIANESTKDNFMFAGTWWNEKYQSRALATKEFFNYVAENNLDFTYYNRNYYRNLEKFNIPEKYKKYEQPALKYFDLVKVYKDFKYHFNLNSVIDDETMFAVRVLELQGMGKKLISNYSLPIYVDYPNISIFEQNLNLDFPIDDKILGIRNTFANNSIFDFWITVFTEFNLENLITTRSITFVEELTELEKLDITIGFKMFDVGAIAFTSNKEEYYMQTTYVEKYNIVAKVDGSNSSKVLLLPITKYYNYSKQLIVADLYNYEQIAKLDSKKYIVWLDSKIQNSSYINNLFSDFELLSDYTIRSRRVPNQNMDCLALINLLHYVNNIDLVKLENNEIIKDRRIDRQSSEFKDFICQYKTSIKNNEYFNIENHIDSKSKKLTILFAPNTTLNIVNSESVQFAALANEFTSISNVDVITDFITEDIKSKLGFLPQVNFKSIESLNKDDVYKQIIMLNIEKNYDYIITSNIQMLELMYTINPQLLETKVIAAILSQSAELENTIKILNKAKGVQLPSKVAYDYFLRRGLCNLNVNIQLPFVNQIAYTSEKIYDMIYVGEINNYNQTNDFFSLVARYPELNFAIVYTKFSTNLTFEADEFIKYGLLNFDNLTVYNELSNEETLALINQSKFSFALKTSEIETKNSFIPPSKVIEAISTNTFPIVKPVRLNTELLGEDYPYTIKSIDDFNFNDYQPNYVLNYKNIVNMSRVSNELELQYPPKTFVKSVYLDEIPSLDITLNLFDLNFEVETNNYKVYDNITKFGINCKRTQSFATDKHVRISDVAAKFKNFQCYENTIVIPSELIKKLELHNVDLENVNFINEKQAALNIEQLNLIANTKYHFTVYNQRELLSALNIIGKLECDFLKINIITKFEIIEIDAPKIKFNTDIKNSVELGLYDYDLNQLYKLANKEKINCTDYVLSDLVIVNNIYPSYENVYAHAYVHTRTKLYKKSGINPTIIILANSHVPIQLYTYDNQMVIKCSELGFKFLFGDDKDFIFGVHFIYQYIFTVLNRVCIENKKLVWFHGADSLPATLRSDFYNLNMKNASIAYRKRSNTMQRQEDVLTRVFADPTYKSIFVSNWLKKQISERYDLEEERVTVIPNSIDTNTFNFQKKVVKKDERIKFLTIKPFLLEYDIYANQVLVDAITLASKEEWFEKCEFTIYGRGDGFNYYMNQLDNLNASNITYHEKFLTHEEIKNLHDEHHVFLHPVNQDTHGVSFFEAMSSGLVAINSNNSAKIEYCTSGVTGFLHKDQDAEDLCNIMAKVVKNYNDFDQLRLNGHQSVVDQFGEDMVTEKELNLVFEKSHEN